MHESTQIQRLHQELAEASQLFEEKVRDLSIARWIGDSLKYAWDVRRVFETIIDTILEDTNAQNCSLMLLDHETGELTVRAARGQADPTVSYYRVADSSRRGFRLGEGVAGWVAQHGQPISIPDVSKDSRFVISPQPIGFIGSLLCQPLIVEDKVVGVVNLSHPRPHVFTAEDERLMVVIAGQVAVTLNSVQIFDEMQQLNASLRAEIERATDALRMAYDEVDRRVQERTAELAKSNAILKEQIAERERMEGALKASEEMQRGLFEFAPDAIVAVNFDGRIERTNAQVEAMFGYRREELLGKSVEMLVPERFRERHVQHRAGYVSDPHLRSMGVGQELYGRRKDGREFPVDIVLSPMKIQEGGLIIAIVRDITERKEAEEALRESNRYLEEALAELRRAQQQVIQQERLRALGQMASGIAHDFNNALSPILGFSELLLISPESLGDQEKARHYLQSIHTAAQDAAGVVKRLSEFYRRRDERETLLPVRLNQLVKQAISLTQPKWRDQALANGITVEVEADLQEVPLVPADEVGLREALTNLIFNAVDAMPHDGTITLRTRPDGEHVALEVSDTGAGMTEEVRQRCLEPFFTTKGERGTGMGLAMVYGIVQRHKGQIDIQSEPGKGTTFTLRLPLRGEQRAEKRPQEAEVRLRPLRVLIVDDDPVIGELIAEYLARDGHTAERAANGREGLEKFRGGRFDLVVTDRAMPEMSGDQVAVAAKQIAPGVPVLMLTGFGDMMQVSGEKPRDVDFILGKPVTHARLREVLAKVDAKGEKG